MPTPLVRLHSLDLVRAFVAVGRKQSITLAAEELCLTQPAVSRQVSSLERLLGVKLFVRGHRCIRFTPEGERFFASADAAVRELQDAWALLDMRSESRPVTITTSIGFAGLWLLPRLGALSRAHPGIDVRVAANNRIFELQGDGVDIAVRYCPPVSAPAGAQHLFGEDVVPVAHASLGLQGKTLEQAADSSVFLEFDDPGRPFLQWTDRLHALKDRAQRPRFVRFNQYDQVIHAALAGQGIALGRLALVRPLIDEGRLQRLDHLATGSRTDYAYWLVLAGGRARQEVLAVARWLQAQAAQTAASL